MKDTFLSCPLLMHDLRGNYILSLNKPRTTSHGLSSFLAYQLSCGIRYLILSVPLSLLVLKENQGPHVVERLFFLINISSNIVYLVMYLYMLSILALNGRY